MPLTPVEIRHVELKRAWLRGYRRRPIDQLLEEIADSFEQVWRERADLSDRLEEDIVKIRSHLRAAFELLGDEPGEKPDDAGEAATAVTRPTPVEEIAEGGIRKVAG